jgi:enoyl-CoA hydratase/carnithine racemase
MIAAMAAVSWSTDGAVTRLTLEQPEKLNALGEDCAREFAAAVRAVAREKSRVVVLSGRGRVFCAGGDLAFIEKNRERPKAALQALMRGFYTSFLSIRSLPQVTIAQVHGAAVGAGLCLALACDLRAVTADARLGFNFVRLGLNPGMAAWPLACAAFGEARARELLFLGRFFSGADLRLWGAACACEPDEAALAARVRELASELAGHSGLSLRLLKRETALGPALARFLSFEARGQADCFKGPDIAEGVSAVRERRAPRFSS